MIYNITRNNSDFFVSSRKGKYIKKIMNVIEYKDEKYISLAQWVEWTREQFSGLLNNSFQDCVFDPRFSEWTALEIVKQIAEKLNAKVHYPEIGIIIKNDDYYYNVHPTNYLIPRKWIEKDVGNLTWEEWYKIIQNEEEVTLRKKKMEFINDVRYTPVIVDPFGEAKSENSVIFGLGSILVGLLGRTFKFPPFNNRIGELKGLTPFHLKLSEEYPVSSRTLGIIHSCFSKRNRETRLLKVFQEFLEPDDDFLIDPPEIFYLKELIDELKKSQDILKKYRLTVHEHKPRQLVPLSLIQLNRKNKSLGNQGDNKKGGIDE